MSPDDLPALAATRFDLGPLVGSPERRHGGVNGLWRVATTRGSFAVHAMHGGRTRVRRCESTMAVEVAAGAAGVVLARPVPDPSTGRAAVVFDGFDDPVVVHEWVDAEPAHVERSDVALYRRLGSSIAVVHSLGLDASAPLEGDVVDHRLPEDEWRELAAAARRRGLPWADDIAAGAAELVAADETVLGWGRGHGERQVIGHRDLTSQNVLDAGGLPVLIDWEDAGPIAPGTELGRTALDNLWREDGTPDDEKLAAFLGGYAEVASVPAIGPHWCSLWVRGLVVFVEHCVRSCIDGTADTSLLRFQSDVVQWAMPELRRRLDRMPRLVTDFERAFSRI